MSTTNGTRAIVTAAERCERVLIASLLNLEAVTEAARAHGDDVAIFCAGVKGSFALDDSYVAGPHRRRCSADDRSDAAEAAVRLAASYATAEEAFRASRSGRNLINHGPELEADIPYCARESVLDVVPRLDGMHGVAAEITRVGRPPCSVAVVLFTRDLRVHDNPALAGAVEEAETVLPLFVLDEGIGAHALRRGGEPARVPPRGARRSRCVAPIGSAARSMCARATSSRKRVRAAREVGATTVFASADVSPYAVARERRLARRARSPPRRRHLRRSRGGGDPDRATTTIRSSRRTIAPGRRCRSGVARGDPGARSGCRPGVEPGRGRAS